MDKKILFFIILIIIAAVAAAGVFVFKYLNQGSGETSTSAGQKNPLEQTPQVQMGGVQVEGENGQNNAGGLIICLDKCGDGVCQKSDPDCTDSMNCICPETAEECQQDCK